MKLSHRLETLLVRGIATAARRAPWPAVLRWGAAIGSLAGALGIRRNVARANLRLAFPDRSRAELEAILAAHYRELGRVAVEYPRNAALAAMGDAAFAALEGFEHMQAAAARGRGVIIVSGHYGNFELFGAAVARRHRVDYVVKPLSNPGVEAIVAGWRAEAGVGAIPVGAGAKGIFRALRAGHWVCMLGDQDARRHGVFVPFFGRLASTPAGPAHIALATGAPIVIGIVYRSADGRHVARFAAPLWPEGDARDVDAVRALTARHTATLEAEIRARPEHWFWLHRRWKTPPPAAGGH